MTNEEKLNVLRDRMLKILTKHPYSANRNHVNKIASQMRYLEKFIKVSEGKDN